jgi:hypothetical protein
LSSGDPVLQILGVRPPRATSAYPTQIAGGSTPAENIVVWSFPDAATTYLDYLVALHGYDGGGLTVRFAHGTQSGTLANNVRISAAFRRIQDDAEDLDTSQTYDYNDATFTTASAREEWAYDTITFTNGADMDSLANNEYGILRIRRQPADAADTLAGTWHIGALSGTET